MTENMKKLLELISKDEALGKTVCNATKEELIALAKELSIELSEANFAQPVAELSDDELNVVAGGKSCYCAAGGGGTGSGACDDTCVCVIAGVGEGRHGPNYSNYSERCVCALAGYGESFN